MKKIFLMVLILFTLCPVIATAKPVGNDLNGNGLWDDFDRIVSHYPSGSVQGKSIHYLASQMQEFVLSPPQNQSLAAQAMSGVQESLLCVYATHGPEGSAAIRELSQLVLNDPERAKRFINNQEIIRGLELPFNPDPKQWIKSCPPWIQNTEVK